MKISLLSVFTTVLIVFGMQCHGNAEAIVADWITQGPRAAIGVLDGALITGATSGGSEFVAIIDGRFSGDAWQAEMPLSSNAESLAVGDANPGDTHTFVFVNPIQDLLLYIENFDSDSRASVSTEGAGAISLLSNSPSIAFDPTLGILSTTNTDSNGEGDLILSLEGNPSSVSIDFTSGTGQNGVFYTFASAPEPIGSSLLLLGLLLVGAVGRRRHRPVIIRMP